MKILLALALLLVALAYAGRSGGENSAPCGGCCPDPSTKMLTVVKNVIGRSGAGGLSESASVVAASDSVIIQMVNSVVILSDARSKQNISTSIQRDLFGAPPGILQGGSAVFDQIHRRFFLSSYTDNGLGYPLDILSPASIQGKKAGTNADFGPGVFTVTGDVVAAVPYNVCTPITNNVTGKIVLVTRGACPFAVKELNVQAANGIAMVVANNQPGLVTMGASIAGNFTIPAIMITQQDGNQMLANLPSPGITATLTGPADVNFTGVLYFAVSKDDSPRTMADFWTFNYTTPGVNTNYSKISVNNNMLIVSTLDYGTLIGSTGQSPFLGRRFIAFNATGMMQGLGNNADGSGINATWVDTSSTYTFAMPAQIRTPVTSPNQPVFLVGKGSNDNAFFNSLQVSWATLSGLQTPTPVIVPLGKTYYSGVTLARQPLPPTRGLELNNLISTAVVRGGSLWTAFSYNISAVHNVIELIELDISTTLENGAVLLKQRTTINPGTQLDLSYPSLSISATGHVLINFAVSGPATYASMGNTWHYANDPPNTVRYPIQFWYKGNNTYNSNPGGNINLYQMVTGCVFAPDSDTVYDNGKEVAYMVGDIPDPLPPGALSSDGATSAWALGLGEIMIDNDNDGCIRGPITEPRNVRCNDIEEALAAHDHSRRSIGSTVSEKRRGPNWSNVAII
jgi:hypothetical protein